MKFHVRAAREDGTIFTQDADTLEGARVIYLNCLRNGYAPVSAYRYTVMSGWNLVKW